MMSPTQGEGESAKRCRYYYVKWMTRRKGGQKYKKKWLHHLWMSPKKKPSQRSQQSEDNPVNTIENGMENGHTDYELTTITR